MMPKIEPIDSSYAQNDFGKAFYSIVRCHRPTVLVEIGVLHGYSALHMGMSVKHNHSLYGHPGILKCYDIWDKYQYNHAIKNEVQERVNKYELQDYVKLEECDAFEVHKFYSNSDVHLAHIDISNDGAIVEEMLNLWHPKICGRGMIIFEGGSEERDRVEWMIKYNKKPISPFIQNSPVIQEKYWHGIYRKFPSLTILLKIKE